MLIGYHASHEQFSPSLLMACAQAAEEAGFASVKSSDHFQPWSERQGQSGFTWSWLGASMAVTSVPFGSICAPGYRYHPAVIAQGAATLAEMFPDRFWLAIGSGQAINEAMTGLPWPEKAERNARLNECAAVIKALLAGETVTHRGRITVIEAKLYSRPETPPPIFGAAVTEETARMVAQWADGLLTTGSNADTSRKAIEAFREAGGEGKPVYVQHALSWAPTAEEAMEQSLDQWSSAVAGGEVNWDLRRPKDFDTVGALISADRIHQSVAVSAEPGWHAERLAAYRELGVDAVYVHNVGTNQRQFIEAFGAKVLPQLAG
jgi:coenzyme F420-dependent glucose-6-phosphate dehydrogenase